MAAVGATAGGRPARRAAVIVNPARVRDLPRLRVACARAFAAGGWAPPEMVLTTPDDPGAGLAAAAIRTGVGLVLAVGGDGTVRACAQSLAGSAVPLGIVPAGSANLVARALRIPGHLAGALATALHGEQRTIDLAMADGTLASR
jgi:diacylglycerol kinase family enzyme